MISAIGARGESICSTQSRLRAKSPCLRTPPGIPEFWREIGMCTHACSESPDFKLQDAPMISAIGARGESVCSTQSRSRAKSPHFDGLIHVLLTGLRISTANRICPESPFHVVFENTIKSKIRFILGSLHHFWLKRCNFCGVRHLLRSKFLMHWKPWTTFIIDINFQELSSWRSWFTIPLNTPPVTVLRPYYTPLCDDIHPS